MSIKWVIAIFMILIISWVGVSILQRTNQNPVPIITITPDNEIYMGCVREDDKCFIRRIKPLIMGFPRIIFPYRVESEVSCDKCY